MAKSKAVVVTPASHAAHVAHTAHVAHVTHMATPHMKAAGKAFGNAISGGGRKASDFTGLKSARGVPTPHEAHVAHMNTPKMKAAQTAVANAIGGGGRPPVKTTTKTVANVKTAPTAHQKHVTAVAKKYPTKSNPAVGTRMVDRK